MSNLQGRKRVHGEQYEKNGTCAFCDFPTEKYICFSAECVRAYNRERHLVGLRHRHQQRDLGAQLGGERRPLPQPRRGDARGATGKTGRHVGKAMVRMVEATETASALLRDLMRHAAEWMTRRCPWTEEAMIKRLGAALVKARATEDAIASIAMALAERGTELPQVIDAIATAAAGERAGRGAALPLEQMAGRLLVHGWEEGLTVKVQAGGEE